MNAVYALGHWSRAIHWPWCQMGVLRGQRHPLWHFLVQGPPSGSLQVRTNLPQSVHRRPPVHSDNTHRESQTDSMKRWAVVSNKHGPNVVLQNIGVDPARVRGSGP